MYIIFDPKFGAGKGKNAKKTGIDSLRDLALHPAALTIEGVVQVRLTIHTSVYRLHVHVAVHLSSSRPYLSPHVHRRTRRRHASTRSATWRSTPPRSPSRASCRSLYRPHVRMQVPSLFSRQYLPPFTAHTSVFSCLHRPHVHIQVFLSSARPCIRLFTIRTLTIKGVVQVPSSSVHSYIPSFTVRTSVFIVRTSI